jgi:P-type Ca2+ transporter type 2C
VPFLAQVFGIVPLSFNEWLLVIAVAFPVVLIDEVLKFVGRCLTARTIKQSRKRKLE